MKDAILYLALILVVYSLCKLAWNVSYLEDRIKALEEASHSRRPT